MSTYTESLSEVIKFKFPNSLWVATLKNSFKYTKMYVKPVKMLVLDRCSVTANDLTKTDRLKEKSIKEKKKVYIEISHSPLRYWLIFFSQKNLTAI